MQTYTHQDDESYRLFFCFSSRRRHTRFSRDWSSDVCSSDLGPYGHRLLAIDAQRSHALHDEVGRGCEGIKPGWVRVNFNYFISDTVGDYLIDAVDLVATHGY